MNLRNLVSLLSRSQTSGTHIFFNIKETTSAINDLLIEIEEHAGGGVPGRHSLRLDVGVDLDELWGSQNASGGVPGPHVHCLDVGVNLDALWGGRHAGGGVPGAHGLCLDLCVDWQELFMEFRRADLK